eukprot:g5646.t1
MGAGVWLAMLSMLVAQRSAGRQRQGLANQKRERLTRLKAVAAPTPQPHVGLMPMLPAAASARDAGWWQSASGSFCGIAERRFQRACDQPSLLTWADRRAAMRRSLNATARWMDRFDIDYFAVFGTLLAAWAGGDALASASTCQVGLAWEEYARVTKMLTLGHLKRHGPLAYQWPVTEDQPWEDRTPLFPSYAGEWWAPLEEVVGVADVGLLYQPQASCSPLRFVDKQTGLFCETVVVDDPREAEADGGRYVQWDGGPQKCPALRAPPDFTRCTSDSCYRLEERALDPSGPCPEPLLGVRLRCPFDPVSVLHSSYSSSQLGLFTTRALELRAGAGGDDEAVQRQLRNRVHMLARQRQLPPEQRAAR